MKLQFSRLAVKRVEEIAVYVRRHNPKAAIQVKDAIEAACALLVEHPHAGRELRPQLRRLVVPRLPYLVYYRVDEDAGVVSILTIRHSARKPLA